MVATVVPDAATLPNVLPSERLLATGVARPEIRGELRRIANMANGISVAWLWAMLVGLVVAVVAVGHPLGYVAGFVLATPLHVRFAILAHEAAHRLLFTKRIVNDSVGSWLLAYPAWIPFGAYRRSHFAHHRQEFGPDEPDIAFYGGYPCTSARLRRRLWRDAIGISGAKNLAGVGAALGSPTARPVAARIVAAQGAMWAMSWLFTGRWYVYPILWFAPWMTGWRVVNRLRAIAEHGGMRRSDDRRQTTHHVRQSWLARFWLVPYHTGWHLAHHVDMGVPWRNLPRFHAELVAAGYATPAIEYPSYRALWRALASG
jgi:fatty acid desaturase